MTNRHLATDEDTAGYMRRLGEAARAASVEVARASTAAKNLALQAIADAIEAAAPALTAANTRDLAAASALDAAGRDRLTLTPTRIVAMAAGLREVAALADPVGTITDLTARPSGIQVGRMRVPLGVVGIFLRVSPECNSGRSGVVLESG